MINRCTPLDLAVRPCFFIAYVIGRLLLIKWKKNKNKQFWNSGLYRKQHGHNITDEQLTKVAIEMKLKPKVLIKKLQVSRKY